MRHEFIGLLLALSLPGCQGNPDGGPCATCDDGGPAKGDTIGGGGDIFTPGGDQAPGGDSVPPGDTFAPPGDADPCGSGYDVTESRLAPVPGEVFYAQLDMPGFAMGEAALIVGTDGTLVLVDTGNDSHDDNVRDEINTVINQMNADGGFGVRGANTLDHIILTHFHADHADGFSSLLGSLTVSGRVIHRGFYDVAAANDATVGNACSALAAHPGMGRALCEGAAEAPCDAATWVGTYPSTGCAGLGGGDLTSDGNSGPAHLPIGPLAAVDLIAVNGVIGTDRFEDDVGAIDTADSNGDNARSVVALLRLGEFRLLFAGDLTGGGSDTDDLEGYFAPRLGAAGGLGARGVDVLHLGHHGRDTSSSVAWLDALLPGDGMSRNAVIGISGGHANSPHQVVVDNLFADDRLADGRGWTTETAFLGATHPDLLDAGGGTIIVRSDGQGSAYLVQAVNGSTVLWTRRYQTVRTCPP